MLQGLKSTVIVHSEQSQNEAIYEFPFTTCTSLQPTKYCSKGEQFAADQAKRALVHRLSHNDVPPLSIFFKRCRPLISTAHLPPAIKTVVMASEEAIPIIVEFT